MYVACRRCITWGHFLSSFNSLTLPELFNYPLSFPHSATPSEYRYRSYTRWRERQHMGTRREPRVPRTDCWFRRKTRRAFREESFCREEPTERIWARSWTGEDCRCNERYLWTDVPHEMEEQWWTRTGACSSSQREMSTTCHPILSEKANVGQWCRRYCQLVGVILSLFTKH